MRLNKLFCLVPAGCLVLCLSSFVPVVAQSAPADEERSAAIKAIEDLNLIQLRALLNKNAALIKPEVVDGEDGDTLLHHATRRGILSGGSLSAQDSDSLVAILGLLIERKANVNARDRGNQTPLGYAAQWRSNLEGARVLLASGADMNAKLPGLRDTAIGGTALHMAVAVVDLPMVEFLIEKKADVNAKDGAGNTPLLINSATGGHTAQADIAKALIAAHAMVNTQNIYGATALYKACGESSEVAEVLLANGADPNLKTKEGESPAQAAIGAFDSRATLRLLIKHKADLTIKDKEGRTLLHRAGIAWDTNCAETLLDNGSDINAKDGKGYTSLIFAVSDEMLVTVLGGETRPGRGGREDTVELLLQRGANANIPDQAGNTSLHHAAREDRRVILRLLLENKGDPNFKNNEGMTPLHTATTYDQIAIVKMLLANKVDATIKDKEGKTALDRARQYGRDEIAVLLAGK